MRLYRAARTCGALKDRFERDAAFGDGVIVSGPAATHAGLNDGLALRFGTYRRKPRPKDFGTSRLRVFWGRYAEEWAKLSRLDGNWLALGKIAVRW